MSSVGRLRKEAGIVAVGMDAYLDVALRRDKKPNECFVLVVWILQVRTCSNALQSCCVY